MPPALRVVRGKKPKIARKMWGGKGRDAMPHDFREINILNRSAVEMDFICVCEALELLGHATFGSMAFVKKRRDNSQAWVTTHEPTRPGGSGLLPVDSPEPAGDRGFR